MLNKEAEGEHMMLSHNTEVKVFLQKLKLLEYEHEKADMSIEKDGEEEDREDETEEEKLNELERWTSSTTSGCPSG